MPQDKTLTAAQLDIQESRTARLSLQTENEAKQYMVSREMALYLIDMLELFLSKTPD